MVLGCWKLSFSLAFCLRENYDFVLQCHLFCEIRLCVVLLFVSDTPRLLIGQHSCMVRDMLPPVAVALLTVHGVGFVFEGFLVTCDAKQCCCWQGLINKREKFQFLRNPYGCVDVASNSHYFESFFQEEDVCVFGSVLVSAASPDTWCRKRPFKLNTQNLMSWKCGHVKLGEHWNLAAGSSWLPAAGSIHSASHERSMTEGSSPPFLHLDSERPV